MTQIEPDALLDAIRGIVEAVPGMRRVPDSVPEQIAAWPAAVVYYRNGGYETGDFGIKDGLHNISVDVMMPRKDLTAALRFLDPFIKSIPAALMVDPTFGNLCEPPSRIDYELYNSDYADTPVIGFRFILSKVQTFPYGKR